MRGRSGHDGPNGAGSAPSALRPRTVSNRGSRPPSTRAGGARCTASRSGGRAARSGPPAQGNRRLPPSRRERRVQRSSRPRSGPSGRCGAPCAPPASCLGLLAYRAVDGRARDERRAPDAVLRVRRRRDRRHGPGDLGRGNGIHPRWHVAGGGPERGRRRGAQEPRRRGGR